MEKTEKTTRISAGAGIGRGLKYGWISLAVAMVMGLLYGIIGQRPIAPAIAFVSLAAVMVIFNFVLSLLLYAGSGVVWFFNKRSWMARKYFFISLGFFVVYMAAMGVIKVFNMYWY